LNRAQALERLASERFDVLVIGGGATGLGCALDAASRGYKTALIEEYDFAKGTSSRSTKLIHGGVRYLRQGNIALVREALHERSLLLQNAADYVRPLPFFVPVSGALESAYYLAGLKMYDALAGASRLPKSRRAAGGVVYWDAQFDDSRLAIALARTAWSHGAVIANYMRAPQFHYTRDRLAGVRAHDIEADRHFTIAARAVINATGIFADQLRLLDDRRHAHPALTYSRGSHITVDKAFLPDPRRAILVPKTADGRLLFAIPWHECALIGTTDVPQAEPEIEPVPSPDEVDFLLRTSAPYLSAPPRRADIRSAFAGLRPLIARRTANTAALSREHSIEISSSGLVTVCGGKWTTYRRMAQDAIDAAIRSAGLVPARCTTALLALDADAAPAEFTERVEYAASHEMARTVEDVLARRTGVLFRDAAAAEQQAPGAARALAQALGRTGEWAAEQERAFAALARQYGRYGLGENGAEAKSPS